MKQKITDTPDAKIWYILSDWAVDDNLDVDDMANLVADLKELLAQARKEGYRDYDKILEGVMIPYDVIKKLKALK